MDKANSAAHKSNKVQAATSNKCCIQGCTKIATVRNFTCLRGTWQIKQEFLEEAAKGKTLKICAGHYNEDLRLYPRDKTPAHPSPILAALAAAGLPPPINLEENSAHRERHSKKQRAKRVNKDISDMQDDELPVKRESKRIKTMQQKKALTTSRSTLTSSANHRAFDDDVPSDYYNSDDTAVDDRNEDDEEDDDHQDSNDFSDDFDDDDGSEIRSATKKPEVFIGKETDELNIRYLRSHYPTIAADYIDGNIGATTRKKPTTKSTTATIATETRSSTTTNNSNDFAQKQKSEGQFPLNDNETTADDKSSQQQRTQRHLPLLSKSNANTADDRLKRTHVGTGSESSSDEGNSGRGKHAQFVPNVSLTFNLSNEPCMKYSLLVIADRNYSQPSWTSYRLRKQVLYLESKNTRYELSLISTTNATTPVPAVAATTTVTTITTTSSVPTASTSTDTKDGDATDLVNKSPAVEESDSHTTNNNGTAVPNGNVSSSNNNSTNGKTSTGIDSSSHSGDDDSTTYRYRWATVKNPYSLDTAAMAALQLPLSKDHVDVLHDNLLWSEIQWGPSSVKIREHEYPLHRIQFVDIQRPNAQQQVPNQSQSTPDSVAAATAL